MSARRRAISGTAAAASSLFTVIRTICEPARKRAATCSAVAAASAVSVFVIDWTTTGCDDPAATPRTHEVTVRRRGANGPELTGRFLRGERVGETFVT